MYEEICCQVPNWNRLWGTFTDTYIYVPPFFFLFLCCKRFLWEHWWSWPSRGSYLREETGHIIITMQSHRIVWVLWKHKGEMSQWERRKDNTLHSDNFKFCFHKMSCMITIRSQERNMYYEAQLKSIGLMFQLMDWEMGSKRRLSEGVTVWVDTV